MKATWKNIIREPCRHRDLSNEEATTLPGYQHLQRYFPALDRFRLPTSPESPTTLELPSKYQLTKWLASDPDRPRYWTALRQCTVSSRDTTNTTDTVTVGDTEECKVFMKVVHLIHPIELLRGHYSSPSHPLLPHHHSSWKQTIDKLHHHHNQAYVDAVANYVMSHFREKNILPHGVLYYGSYTAISDQYLYHISGEYESYRTHRWFWKGIRRHQCSLTLSHPDPSAKEKTYYQELYQEIKTLSLLSEDGSEVSDLSDVSDPSDVSNPSDPSDLSDAFVVEPIDRQEEVWKGDTLEEVVEINEMEEIKGEEKEEDEEEDEDEDEEEDEDEDEDDDDDAMEISIKLPHMPVMMILQEAQEGVMDDLLEEEELDGYARESREWENRWVAWLFQVTAILSFLQKAISFTHNDLHTNNIVWRTTDEPYLYYRTADKRVWKVPTYGKIFSLIDFGRSIFRIGRQQWISDDHWPNEDAGGQYNYGPFYQSDKPKVVPNPSFDLCRLSVSLLSGLFDEPPSRRKGKNVPVMSEEGSWKVYETRSPLYNLLWKWTVDDAGRTVYENRNGDEIYEGFDLYIHIAHFVHGAVPRDQFRQPAFQPFLWKGSVPSGQNVYAV